MRGSAPAGWSRSATLVLLVFGCTTAWSSDWSRFRGPNGLGVAAGENAPPVTWGDNQNLKWKIALPGPGSSCPILVGDKIFLTCWTGYAAGSDDLGSKENLKRHLLCLDRKSGVMLWDRAVDALLPEDDYRGMFGQNGYATHTPVSDGKNVYVFFGKSGVHAFDLEGKSLWSTNVGKGLDPQSWGSASSPIIYKNMVIITASAESTSLIALDKKTGKEIWKQTADGLGSTWGTPILVELPEGRTDLVIAVPYEVWGINPDTGKLRWYCESFESNSMCASPIAHEGIVYVVGGRNGGSIAVRAGGEGDVSKSHVLWSGRDAGRISTPVLSQGRLYWISGGIANCINAADGQKVYQSRLPSAAGVAAAPAEQRPQQPGRGEGGRGRGRGGPGGGRGGQDYSSPVAVGDKLYFFTRGGTGYVLEMGTELKVIAQNRFESDSGDFSSTPAIGDGEMFVRSSKMLYCIAE